MIKHALAAFASASGYEAPLTDLNESYAADETELEMSLAASEGKLADADRRIQKVENYKITLDELATKIDAGEAKLRSSRKHVLFLGEMMSEQNK